MSRDVSPRPPFRASIGTRVCSLIESVAAVFVGYFAFSGEWLLVVIVGVGMFGMGGFTFHGMTVDYDNYRAELERKEGPGNE